MPNAAGAVHLKLQYTQRELYLISIQPRGQNHIIKLTKYTS